MTLSRSRYLEALERESTALVEAARGNLDAHVPSCPEWKVSDLLAHLGEVHRAWNELATRALTRPGETEDEQRAASRASRERGDYDPPEGVDLIDWFAEGPVLLEQTLADANLEQPMWTWSRVKTVGFLPRRMAQETAMHRWDVENASGEPSAIDSDLAADGIDELMYVWLPAMAPLKEPPRTSVHVHTTDADGEWLAVLEEEPVVIREHAKGDAALRGAAPDVLLYLWGRTDASSVEILGDRAVLDGFRSVFDLE